MHQSTKVASKQACQTKLCSSFSPADQDASAGKSPLLHQTKEKRLLIRPHTIRKLLQIREPSDAPANQKEQRYGNGLFPTEVAAGSRIHKVESPDVVESKAAPTQLESDLLGE